MHSDTFEIYQVPSLSLLLLIWKGGGFYDKKRIFFVYHNSTITFYSKHFTIKIIKASDFNQR